MTFAETKVFSKYIKKYISSNRLERSYIDTERYEYKEHYQRTVM